MKKTIFVIVTIIGAIFYFKENFRLVDTVREVETVREVDTVRLMVPILVKPNTTYGNTTGIIKSAANDPPIDWVEEMIEGVKYFEGFNSTAYYCCAGIKTIGYGETVKEIVAVGHITEDKADILLRAKLNHIRELVKKEVKVSLSEAQECALTSFTYNLGVSNLKKLINGNNRLNQGNYESINKIMPLYCRAGGKVRKGLVKRRTWEVSLFNSTTCY